MLTIDEFQLAIREHQRFAMRQMIWPSLGVVVAVIGLSLLSNEKVNGFLLANPTLRVGVLLILMAVLLLSMGLAALRLARHQRRDDRLSCPSCNRSLVPRRWYVVASQRCAACGGPVLSTPDSLPGDSTDGASPFPEARFRAASKRQTRFEFVGAALSVVSYLAVVWTPGISKILSSVLRDPDVLVRDDNRLIDVLAIVSLAVCVSTLLILLYRYLFGPGRIWVCPHCRTKLLPHRRIVINTGNCFNCGQQVLAESV